MLQTRARQPSSQQLLGSVITEENGYIRPHQELRDCPSPQCSDRERTYTDCEQYEDRRRAVRRRKASKPLLCSTESKNMHRRRDALSSQLYRNWFSASYRVFSTLTHQAGQIPLRRYHLHNRSPVESSQSRCLQSLLWRTRC